LQHNYYLQNSVFGVKFCNCLECRVADNQIVELGLPSSDITMQTAQSCKHVSVLAYVAYVMSASGNFLTTLGTSVDRKEVLEQA